MNGMQYLLKSMGVDPEEITKTANQLAQLIIDTKSQLDRIEEKLDAVIGNDYDLKPSNILEKIYDNKKDDVNERSTER